MGGKKTGLEEREREKIKINWKELYKLERFAYKKWVVVRRADFVFWFLSFEKTKREG